MDGLEGETGPLQAVEEGKGAASSLLAFAPLGEGKGVKLVPVNKRITLTRARQAPKELLGEDADAVLGGRQRSSGRAAPSPAATPADKGKSKHDAGAGGKDKKSDKKDK